MDYTLFHRLNCYVLMFSNYTASSGPAMPKCSLDYTLFHRLICDALFFLTNYAAPSVPAMPNVPWITPSSIHRLTMRSIFQLCCSLWTRYSYFFLDYTLFCKLGMHHFFSGYAAPCGPGMRSIFPITLPLLCMPSSTILIFIVQVIRVKKVHFPYRLDGLVTQIHS